MAQDEGPRGETVGRGGRKAGFERQDLDVGSEVRNPRISDGEGEASERRGSWQEMATAGEDTPLVSLR